MSKYNNEEITTGSNVICIPVHSKRSRLKKRQIFSATPFHPFVETQQQNNRNTNKSELLKNNDSTIISYNNSTNSTTSTTTFTKNNNSNNNNNNNNNNITTESHLDFKNGADSNKAIDKQKVKNVDQKNDEKKNRTKTDDGDKFSVLPDTEFEPTYEDAPPQTTLSPTTTTTTTESTKSYVPRYANMIGTRKYIPCAVCDIEEQSEHRMIPAESTCPNGWQLQYQGYLMNYHHGTQAGNVICVNDQALGISPSSDAGIRKIVSQYLSHVVIDCKTFPCPPLNHAELLKCVVCSK